MKPVVDPTVPTGGQTKRCWGKLLKRELLALAPLLAGCGQPSAPPLGPPPPAPPASTPPPQPTPEAAPPVGPLAQAGGKQADGYLYNTYGKAVASGAGVFHVYGFEASHSGGAPFCSIPTSSTTVCQAVSFSPWKDPEQARLWPRLGSNLETTADGKLYPQNAGWQRLSPGKGGVYAVRQQEYGENPPLEVDFLRPDGSTEPFVQDTSGKYSDIEIVEVKGQHLAILRLTAKAPEGRPYASFGSLLTGRVVASKGGRTIEQISPLRVGDVWPDGRASDARDARRGSGRAGYGPFRAVALLDASGEPTGEVALVWVEALPPPSRDPEEAGRNRKSKHQCGRPNLDTFEGRIAQRDRYGGGECGGRGSRRLDSSEVRRRLHITRIGADGKPGDDHSEALPREYVHEQSAFVVAPLAGGGLTVDQRTFDAKFKPVAGAKAQAALAAPASFRGPAPQMLLGGAFDPASGEALFLYGEAVYDDTAHEQKRDTTLARRFSAQGEPLGEVIALPEGDPMQGAPLAARAGDAWLVLTSADPQAVRVIGGPRNNTLLPLPVPPCPGSNCYSPPALQAIVQATEGRVEVLSFHGDRLLSTLIDGRTLTPAQPVVLEHPQRATLAVGPSLALRRPDGVIAPWVMTADGASLQEQRDEPKPAKDDANRATLHQVWGDLVVVESTGRATWLKAKKSVTFAKDKLGNDGNLPLPIHGLPGPVLPGDKWILPEAPGELIEAPEALTKALTDCTVRLPTGPRSLLLGCSEATDPKRPSVRVGARTARY